uniref:Serpentine receptor class gamma n=1 Tax=Meloidogyne incognita TaxID=6306 RepID=A0A914KHE3_MELIC
MLIPTNMNQTYLLPPIYMAFSNPGFHLELFLPSLVMLPSIIGLFLNASVCYITWKYWGKYTALKSKTCVLIAINSFLEVLHQSGQFVFFYITATGIDFIPALLAFKIEGYYVISTYVVTFMFLTMSIDKVLAVAFPLLFESPSVGLIKLPKEWTYPRSRGFIPEWAYPRRGGFIPVWTYPRRGGFIP